MGFAEHLFQKRAQLGNLSTDFTFALHAIMRLNQLNMSKSTQKIGLSNGQPPILMLLELKDQQTQKELCDFLRLKPASMTDVLQRMERDGLIERSRDEKDQRSLRVCITEKGNEKCKEFRIKRKAMDEICFAGFSEAEKEGCMEYLFRIMTNLDEHIHITEKGDEQD